MHLLYNQQTSKLHAGIQKRGGGDPQPEAEIYQWRSSAPKRGGGHKLFSQIVKSKKKKKKKKKRKKGHSGVNAQDKSIVDR